MKQQMPAKTEKANLPAMPPAGEPWGTEGASSKDLVITKILLTQANSDACKEGIARPGDLITSTGEVLASKADKNKKLQVLPILCQGQWIVTGPKPAQGYPEFIRRELLTPQNDSDLWKIETFEEEKPVVWHKCLSYLVLLTDRLQSFPFFIDFKNTNKTGGRLLSTILQENKFKGLPAPARVIEISVNLKKVKENSWFIMGVSPKRDATVDEIKACKQWYDLFNMSKIKAANSEDVDNGIN